MPKSIEFGARHRRTIDFGRRKRGAERDLVMAYADHLLRAVLAQNWALDDPALYLELSSKAKTAARRKHKIDATRAALLLDQAEEIMQGERRNPDFSQKIKKIAFKANKRGQLQAFRYSMGVGGLGRWLRIGMEDARNILATKKGVEVPFDSMLTASTINRQYQSDDDFPVVSKYVNPAEKDAEHPIEVTRHFRGGPPGYLSPWQKAMAIGQAELFDTGIKLAPRAAELRAARLSNPGATKPVYQSGLKQATAAQLGRLARVGLRVGRTPTEIRSDLAATGRFTAEQIRRGLDQATTAERRSNPPSWKVPKGYEREYQSNKPDLELLYSLALQFYSRQMPRRTPQYIADAHKLAKQELETLPYTFKSDPKTTVKTSFREFLQRRIEEYKTDLTDKAKRRTRRNPPVREIYETFNGRLATRENSVDAPRGTPARVAQLGRLRLIKTRDGRSWKFPGDRAPFLAADSRGKLHVVGGAYRANPAGESCGEIEQIEYQTSKPHLGHENETIYYHQLGEETGVMPELEITPEGHLKIVGGDYRIEADGIHN